MPRAPRRTRWTALLLMGALGCAHYRGGAHPAMEGSRGKPSGGWLVRGEHLAGRGVGYEVLRPDAQGGQHWGASRLVALVQRLGRTLAPRHGGVALRVGDLSGPQGGEIPRHRSHRNGRDVDLLFYARDAVTDVAVPAPDFVRYDRALLSRGRATPLRFDLARNWDLVEALARDHAAGVARIFVASWLRAALLTYAQEHGKDAWVVDRVSKLLLQPGDSLPHDDHFHVRVACTTTERSLGCVDGAPLWPWMIKDWEKGDAISNDDASILDLMEPLSTGSLFGPPTPFRAALHACLLPPTEAVALATDAMVCR